MDFGAEVAAGPRICAAVMSVICWSANFDTVMAATCEVSSRVTSMACSFASAGNRLARATAGVTV